MRGLGTIINTLTVLLGGTMGMLFKKLISSRLQENLPKATGICVLFLGIGGVVEKFVTVGENGKLSFNGGMIIILSIVLGTLLGELMHIEDGIERFGKWLRKKTGSEGDSRFLDGFLTSTLTVCIGAMAVVGAIEDGLSGDFSTLLAKSVLDLITVTILASSLGKGCIFSAIPVFLFQGLFTLLAGVIAPIMTESAVDNLSGVGSVLIFCVGMNLIRDKKIRVANMLPALLFAIAAAFIPLP